MKRYKNIDLDYGVNTALMEAYTAMMAEQEEEDDDFLAEAPEMEAVSRQPEIEVDEIEADIEGIFELEDDADLELADADAEVAQAPIQGESSEIIEFDEE